MKTQNKKPAKTSPSKGDAGNGRTSAPRNKKQEELYEETEKDDSDIESINPDPTKPNEETSHKKKHKIGFNTK